MKILLCLAAVLLAAEAKSVCYDDIGCFDNNEPFKDMPLPMDPEVIQPAFNLFRAGQPGRALKSANEINVADLIVLTHGFGGNMTNTAVWNQPIINNLLTVRPSTDVVFVDWGKGADYGSGLKIYSQPASNTRVIGRLIITFLQENPAFDSTKVHCIGFSLGAHVCGFAGKFARGGWGRISAIDPAGPNFDKDNATARVDKTDAIFVDAIHTSWCGLQFPIGHVDFFANGAVKQPGCFSRKRRSARPIPLPEPGTHVAYVNGFPSAPASSYGIVSSLEDWVEAFFGCSHERAPQLYANSIINPQSCSFFFCSCDNKKAFENGKCDKCEEANGSHAGWPSINYPGRGSFWGHTTDKAPFCA